MIEILDVYTKDGRKVGEMSKKAYYNGTIKDVPWIKCCTCFVIDSKTGKILFEKRGNVELDSGKLDLCSGHVRSRELPFQAMIRELGEELNLPENVASNIKHLSDVHIDYTGLSDEDNRKRLKAIVSIYALKVQDINQIKKDSIEVVRTGWLSYEDSVNFIRNGMTRIPYEEPFSKQIEDVFSKLKDYISSKRKDSDKIY
jgi:8-oxo-dGTP pyrophosphatase MutT (NUDIX family)